MVDASACVAAQILRSGEVRVCRTWSCKPRSATDRRTKRCTILQVQDKQACGLFLNLRAMKHPTSLAQSPSYARCLAAFFLVAGSLACSHAIAQPVTTWLDNQTESHQCSFGGAPDATTRFRTGSLPLTLEAVDLAWGDDGASPAGYNRVGIFAHDNATNLPSSTQIGDWQEASGPTQPGTTMSYSGQTIELAAHTDYWLMVDITDGAQLSCTLSATFNSPAEAGSPAMSQFLLGGAIGAPWGSGPRSNYNPIYALAGSIGTAPPTNPDMAISLIDLPAFGILGSPYSGSFECANIGQESTQGGATCSISGLPPGLGVSACTVSPSDSPWNQSDDVPAGERVACQITGVAQTVGTYSVLMNTSTEIDANPENNDAERTITITATGQPPTPGGVQAVPTLSEWATLLLGLVVAAVSVLWIRRQSQR